MLVVGVVAAALAFRKGDDRADQDLVGSTTGESTTGESASSSEPQFESESKPDASPAAFLPDDGHSLWVSPTAGDPIDCSYLLPGTQLVLHVRVAELLSHSEGEKVVAALGPWGKRATQRLTAATGVALAEIESLTCGIRPTRGGSLEYAVRLNLAEPRTDSTPSADCFLPPSAGGEVLVYCASEALSELKQQGQESPLFARELRRVLDQTDNRRSATLVFAGKFLQISGEKLLLDSAKQLLTALVDFLGDEATATACSMHWDEHFFLELQSTVALNERPHQFAALLEQRIATSSDQVENTILAEPVHPYGRKILARFPAMLRKVGNYTRSGERSDLSVLRAYLPIRAGHNLAMATELLLNARAVGATATAPVAAVESNSVTARLQRTASLVFPKETLQKALEILSEELGVPIEIAGRDLQLEGITKNQSLALDLRDRPAEEILLAVLLRANPDRTAAGPTDEKQKLVYVIRQAARGEGGAIVVTTRAAARRRGEELPAVFEPAPR